MKFYLANNLILRRLLKRQASFFFPICWNCNRKFMEVYLQNNILIVKNIYCSVSPSSKLITRVYIISATFRYWLVYFYTRAIRLFNLCDDSVLQWTSEHELLVLNPYNRVYLRGGRAAIRALYCVISGGTETLMDFFPSNLFFQKQNDISIVQYFNICVFVISSSYIYFNSVFF